MITYDLRCPEGHVFEAWFKDRESFLAQQGRGLVECFVCGSTDVEMVFSGCAVRTAKHCPDPVAADSLLLGLTRLLERHFEDVGPGFAEEARRIHYGESDKRGIRGIATVEEESALRDEGIEFARIALPKLES